MKSALVTFPFLFFAFLTKLPFAFSEPVLDTNGNPILPGVKYYVTPAIYGPPGGGVTLGLTSNSNCPVTAFQDFSEVANGLPVVFNTHEISSDIISTGIPLDIEFIEKPVCASSATWMVFVDNEIQKACVGIGGPEDHLGQQTLRGTFNIQKFGPAQYKLVFCVAGSPTCLDIGRYDAHNGESGRRLNLTEHEPFVVVFIDATYFHGIRSVV